MAICPRLRHRVDDCTGLTLGGSVKGDPVKVRDGLCPLMSTATHGYVQDIIKTAWDNGINTFDCAESYAAGQSEIEMYVVRTVYIRDWRLILLEVVE